FLDAGRRHRRLKKRHIDPGAPDRRMVLRLLLLERGLEVLPEVGVVGRHLDAREEGERALVQAPDRLGELDEGARLVLGEGDDLLAGAPAGPEELAADVLLAPADRAELLGGLGDALALARAHPLLASLRLEPRAHAPAQRLSLGEGIVSL